MRFRGYTIATQPVCEPVSLYEFKQALRLCVSDTDDDPLLTSLLVAARQTAEQYQRRAFIQQGVSMSLDCLPQVIQPVLPDLVSVESITYLDSAGDTQTLSSDLYDVDTLSLPGRITKAYGQTYPTTYAQESAVTVNYTAGYKKYTGAFNSHTTGTISVDFTSAIPTTGTVYLVNATGQWEAYSYRNAFNNSGVWTMTLPTSLAYTYAEDDVVMIFSIPDSTRLGIMSIASQMYEHPAMQSEVSLSNNRVASMLLNINRVPEFY